MTPLIYYMLLSKLIGNILHIWCGQRVGTVKRVAYRSLKLSETLKIFLVFNEHVKMP